MNAKLSSDRWMRRALCLAALMGGLSSTSNAADNNQSVSDSEICRLSGGAFTDLGGGRYRCCWANWGCWDCAAGGVGCVGECMTRRCCQMNDISDDDHCFVFSEAGEEGDDTRPEGRADHTLVGGVLDASAEDDGMIIIVGGHLGEIPSESAVLVPLDPPGHDSMLLQIDLLMSMEPEDEGLGGEEELMDAPGNSAGEEDQSDGAEDDDELQESDSETVPITAPSGQDLGSHRGGRRGRARR